MGVAQRLYEAGRITYMRTDSTNGDVALEAAEKEIGKTFGSEHAFKRTYASKARVRKKHTGHSPYGPFRVDHRRFSRGTATL